MPLSQQKPLLIGIALLATMIVVTTIVAYRNARVLHEDAQWVAHTHEVIHSLDTILSRTIDAETGQRGFVTTGNPAYLEPCQNAEAAAEQEITRFADLTGDNDDQKQDVPELKALLSSRFKEVDQVIAVRKSSGFDAARKIVLAGNGKKIMDSLRALIARMERRERDLLEIRRQTNVRAYASAIGSALFAALLGFALVGTFLWLLQKHLTSLVQSAAVIHEQREVLQATLASIGDAVIATDERGRVTFLNAVAQQLTGWDSNAARGQALEKVFHIVNEGTRQVVANPAERALREGKITGLANHTILISGDGKEWPIDDSAAPIRSASGQMIGAILVFREISERKQRELALREADRRKDEFLATLAHELRNPLAPLSNALQLWPFVEQDRREMENLRTMMERQVQQMTRLIDDLMDVSRIAGGKIQLKTQQIDLGSLLASTIESMQSYINACSHKLTLNIPAEPVFVDGDAARITQVFGNVLHNAIKYTGRNGAIDVVLESDRATATVRIRDNGPGIPKPMLSHIFEMFCQVDQTLDRSHGGLGIGLTLVKRLVEMHGGTVEARSDGPGKGSEFLIRLPRLTHDRAKAELSQAPPTLQQIESMPRHRILVVDDVEASARTLAMMLQAMGQEVTALNDGPAALQWVLANRPDIVFLDIAMPGMDGYEVARRIRDSANSDGPLLVALTGYGQDEDRRIALEAGFNRHLTKPANLIALYEILLARPERRRDADTASTLAS